MCVVAVHRGYGGPQGALCPLVKSEMLKPKYQKKGRGSAANRRHELNNLTVAKLRVLCSAQTPADKRLISKKRYTCINVVPW